MAPVESTGEPSAEEDEALPSPRVLSSHAHGDGAEMPHAAVGVQTEELERTALLTAYLFVASSLFVLGRTTRDALFLSFYGPRATALLPWMFVAFGAVSAAVAVLYDRLADRARRDRLVLGTCLGAGAFLLGVRLLLPFGFRWLPSVFYVAAELLGNLFLVQFWSVANALHDARSARRLFGLIGVGRTLGVLACGLGASGFVQDLGTPNLLLVLAGMCALVAALVRLLSQRHGLGNLRVAPPSPVAASGTSLLRDPYVRRLALVLLVGFVAVNVGDFQFKAAARLAHPQRDDLARFMSLYYATLGGAALVIQLGFTPYLLRRFGVQAGALVLPVGYLVANLGVLLAPSIQTFTVLKLADNALQYTVFDATLQLMYFPLPAATRGRTRTFLETVAKPAGYGLAGLLVLLLRWAHPPEDLGRIAMQSAYVVPLVLVWVALVPGAYDRYLDALRRALARRDSASMVPAIGDATTRDALLRALEEHVPRVQCYALEQLAAHDEELARQALPKLLGSPSPQVRAAAAGWAGRLSAQASIEQVRAQLADPVDACATSAIAALGELLGEDAVPELVPLLDDPRPAVQDAAMATLLAHGGLEGTLVAGRQLEAWIATDSPETRRRAATLLAEPGLRGMSRVIRRLLADPDRRVRRAALLAAGASRDPKALPLVLAALSEPRSEKTAVRALAAIGPAAVAPVGRRLATASTPRSERLALPRVLQLIATREAYDALLAAVDDEDEWVRQKVLAAASRLRGRKGFAPLERARAREMMRRELDRFDALAGAYAPLREKLCMPLVDAFVLDRLRKALVRAMRVAELSVPYARAAAARDQLFSPDAARRAVAQEMIANLLEGPVRERLSVQVDAVVAMRTKKLPPLRGGPAPEARALALEFLEAGEAFARVVALDIIQFRALDVPWEPVIALLRDGSAAVREMAALTLAMRRPPRWREALDGLRDDPDAVVRAYVRYVLATGRTGMEDDESMYTTLEKLLYLQRIELFAEVPPEHLLALARSATVERRPRGEAVFRTGDPGDALYFIIEGSVRVEAPDREPATFREGEVFGEMSVLDSAARAATASVVDDVTLLRIAQEDFYDVLHGTAELAEGVIHVLVRRLRAATPGG